MVVKNFLKKLLQKIFPACRVDYVTGTEALPMPFSAEEERDLVVQYEGGNEDAGQQLIEHNLRLVVYVARKFDNTGVDLDDLISIGTIGLIKAVRSFNSEKKIKALIDGKIHNLEQLNISIIENGLKIYKKA